jgi:hypothetical protein
MCASLELEEKQNCMLDASTSLMSDALASCNTRPAGKPLSSNQGEEVSSPHCPNLTSKSCSKNRCDLQNNGESKTTKTSCDSRCLHVPTCSDILAHCEHLTKQEQEEKTYLLTRESDAHGDVKGCEQIGAKINSKKDKIFQRFKREELRSLFVKNTDGWDCCFADLSLYFYQFQFYQNDNFYIENFLI